MTRSEEYMKKLMEKVEIEREERRLLEEAENENRLEKDFLSKKKIYDRAKKEYDAVRQKLLDNHENGMVYQEIVVKNYDVKKIDVKTAIESGVDLSPWEVVSHHQMIRYKAKLKKKSDSELAPALSGSRVC